jgi:hypothetical protein
VAVGLGRGAHGAGVGLAPRFVTLAALLPCVVYLTVVLYVPGPQGHWLQIGFLLLSLGLMVLNAQRGLFHARALSDRPPPSRVFSQLNQRPGLMNPLTLSIDQTPTRLATLGVRTTQDGL